MLILDEPTSGLDPNQIIEIREVIKQLGQSKTILFSSHILQEVEAICDRVIIINKGRLVADDKLSTLQQGNKDKHIVLVQFQEPIETAMLETLNEVESVEKLQNSNFKIQTSNPELVRRQLLQLSLQHNLNIISLQSENQRLEDVFRVLTSAKTDGAVD